MWRGRHTQSMSFNRIMKLTKTLVPAVAAIIAAQMASAQEITPVWYQQINGSFGVSAPNKLPILAKPSGPETDDNQDGTETIAAYAGLLRYNATKLLLEVRENGINESDPGLTPAQKALAAQYPDHSLIWLDAATGAPLGLAFSEIANPPTLLGIDVTAADQGGQGSPVNFWWRVALDDGPDGGRALYSSHKHIILRYAPKPGGGWVSTPTIAYEEQVGGIGDGLSNGNGSQSWRWRDFHVHGSGTNTVIYAGGATWRVGQQPQVLVTTDGLNFHSVARVDNRDNGARRNDYALGGISSFPIQLPSNYGSGSTNPPISVVFAGHFPGTGWPARPNRYTLNPANPTPSASYNQQPNVSNYERNESGHQGLPPFAWGATGINNVPYDVLNDGVAYYDGNWNCALAADASLGYIVAYAMPSWNNQYGGKALDGSNLFKPGWVGIHRLDGSIASGKSSWKLDAVETDVASLAEDGSGNVGAANAYDGWVELNPDKTAPVNSGKAEALVAFGTYGFGVFSIQNTAAALVSSPVNQTVTAGSSNLVISAVVNGSPNDFQWFHNGAPVSDDAKYLGTAKKVALKFAVVTPADAGTYQLKWTNPITGAGQTAPATLTVTPASGFGASLFGADINPGNTTVNPAPGSTVTTGTNSFVVSGGGLVFLPSVGNTDQPGDLQQFAYETVSGDFDKSVKLTSLTASDSDLNASAGLEVRETLDSNSASLILNVGNPAGRNSVEVWGRAIKDQKYTLFSRSYSGVAGTIPNQWLRIRRAGNNFSFFVGTNGTTWSLIGERYSTTTPGTVLVGTYAFSAGYDVNAQTGGNTLAVASFSSYGNTPITDTVAPALVSVGSTDGKTVGVKFSKVVDSSSAVLPLNYKLSQGFVTGAKLGIGGDSVYLTVSGLSSPTFTVTVLGGVADRSGNTIAANSSASGKISNWKSTDIGNIQNLVDSTMPRPSPGDDPYLPGQAVAVSSGDTETEIEVVGGGSNAWNPGDYLQYLSNGKSLTGDFDVTVEVSRDDRPATTGGYANSGLMVRTAPYLAGQEGTPDGTKVQMFALTTYAENSAPARSAIPLWRSDDGGGYGNGNPGFSWSGHQINGVKGYFLGLNAVDAGGTPDTASLPTSARWLRLQRIGDVFTSKASYDGIVWDQVDANTVALPSTLLFGFSVMNDTGATTPPNNAYGDSGHIDPNDPLNGQQNESHYSVLRIRIGTNVAPRANPAPATIGIQATASGVTLTFTGTLQWATTPKGPFVNVPNASSPWTIPTTDAPKFYRSNQ